MHALPIINSTSFSARKAFPRAGAGCDFLQRAFWGLSNNSPFVSVRARHLCLFRCQQVWQLREKHLSNAHCRIVEQRATHSRDPLISAETKKCCGVSQKPQNRNACAVGAKLCSPHRVCIRSSRKFTQTGDYSRTKFGMCVRVWVTQRWLWISLHWSFHLFEFNDYTHIQFLFTIKLMSHFYISNTNGNHLTVKTAFKCKTNTKRKQI
jgi:uncharacterized membrane protein